MRPQVLVDIYKASNRFSGLGQFSVNYATATELMIQKPEQGFSDFDFRYLVPSSFPEELLPFGKQVSAGWRQRYFPSLVPPYAIWHSLHQFPSHFPNPGSLWILTVHDLNFLVEKEEPRRSRYLKKLQNNVNKAHAVTTISGTTRQVLEAHVDLRDKEVQVIYNGVQLAAFPEAERPSFLREGNFFFSIGLFSEKKNFHSLVPLLEYFPDHYLVLAGMSDNAYGRRIVARAREAGLADRLVLPGKVSEAEKYWLYTHCRAFLFPSLAEGFGLPVIEAMLAGKPVFLSRAGSLPEIGSSYAWYFDDVQDGASMAAFMKQKLKVWEQNPSFKTAMKQYSSRFKWSSCIKQYQQLYQQVWKHHSR